MRVVAALLSVCALAACQTPCPAPDTGPSVVQFTCEDGSRLEVTFTRAPDVARIVEEGYTPLTLPARISGSGYRYTDGSAELRWRGAQTAWTRPGSEETLCDRHS